jgi:hypothetical protein
MSSNEPNLVDTVFKTIFEPDVRKRLDALRANHERNVQRFASMRDEELAERAAYYLRQIQRPKFSQGEPVYDVVMHDVILPELIKRLTMPEGG